jgi:hypothetical protein
MKTPHLSVDRLTAEAHDLVDARALRGAHRWPDEDGMRRLIVIRNRPRWVPAVRPLAVAAAMQSQLAMTTAALWALRREPEVAGRLVRLRVWLSIRLLLRARDSALRAAVAAVGGDCRSARKRDQLAMWGLICASNLTGRIDRSLTWMRARIQGVGA